MDIGRDEKKIAERAATQGDQREMTCASVVGEEHQQWRSSNDIFYDATFGKDEKK